MEKVAAKALLDKSIFNKTVSVLACKIPVKLIGEFQKKFKNNLLQIPAVRNVKNLEEEKDKKQVLLSQDYGSNTENIPGDLKSFLQEKEIPLEEENIQLDYNNFSCHEALEKILPEGVTIPSGFEAVGHIAHMNLGEEHMDYRYLIGQIFLDKNPSIKTVLTKVGFIGNVYRTFDFEVLAGEEKFETTQVEDNIKFDVDISKVYWCSRLSNERTRVIEEFFNPGDVICDMFCGIGPLSVRAAKMRNTKVLANDLNPDCYHYLRKNIVQNKVADLVIPFCMDGREFVRHVIAESNNQEVLAKEEEKKEEPTEEDKKKKKKRKYPTQREEEVKLVAESETISPIPNRSFLHFDHVYMNLPMDAIEFLDVFIGLFNQANPEVWDRTDKPEGMQRGRGLPLIHVYGFTVENQDKEKAKENFAGRIGEVFKECGGFSGDQILRFHNNRDVSKVSSMYCISFRLPEEVAYHNQHKRKKVEEQE